MHVYSYSEKVESPDLDAIHANVALSEMTNKTLLFCCWEQALARLCCIFEKQLLTADKIIFDAIASGA